MSLFLLLAVVFVAVVLLVIALGVRVVRVIEARRELARRRKIAAVRGVRFPRPGSLTVEHYTRGAKVWQ